MQPQDLRKAFGIKDNRKEFELLPDREWLRAEIEKVEYRQAKFKGELQYYTDQKTEQFILDDNGQKIPRMEFNITFKLLDYFMDDNVTNRKAWLRVGASLNGSSHFSLFLINVLTEEPTLSQTEKWWEWVVNNLPGIRVKLQLRNSKPNANGKIWQEVIYDAVKLDGSKQAQEVKTAEEIWDEA